MRVAIAALAAASAVLLGAFGAHVLKTRIDSELLAVWGTASQYHLIHAVALVVLAKAGDGHGRSWNVLLAGMLLFSGSLYLLSVTGIRALGAVTPVGGVLLVAGWTTLAHEAWKSRPRS